MLVTDRLQQGDCSVHGPLIIIKDTEVHIRTGDRQAATEVHIRAGDRQAATR